jgi:NAD(P) transhydrogenase
VDFDEESILDSDGILRMVKIPGSLVVVGAGVIGIEYASMFAALGAKVTVGREAPAAARVLRRPDRRGAPVPPARPRRDVPLRRAGDRVEKREGGTITHLASGKRIAADAVMYSAAARARPKGSTSRPPGSRPTTAGGSWSTTTTGRRCRHIYAVGDVIGFPSLAATSMEQGGWRRSTRSIPAAVRR